MVESTMMVDVFLAYLKAESASLVFGVPGGLLHPFFFAVERDADMKLVVTKHEQGAAFMADGYARVSGSLAVCAGTSGPGSTNLLTGVAVAFADGVPMLVITGQAPSDSLGRGAAQETPQEDIDIVAMFRPVTKYSAMVISPQSATRHLRRALREALTGRPGPVHLNVPVDFWKMPVEEDRFGPESYRPSTATFDRQAVKHAAEALIEARNPVLLLGSGVATPEARAVFRDLAALLKARVVTTPRGKGTFPEDDPLSLGVLGFAGHQHARRYVLGDDVDVLAVIGASLNETSTFNWHPGLQPSKTLIHVDISVDRIGRNYPVDIPLAGDARTVGVEIMYALWRLINGGRNPRSEGYQHPPPHHPGEDRYLRPDLRLSDQVPLTPQRWRRELDEALPDDAVVFSDIGGHMLFNIQNLCIRSSQRFVLNLGFGSMGHGTVAPIGGALAPDHGPVIAIIGDACFTMNGMELLTAREYGVPVVWIVEHNQGHGITWHGSRMVEGGEGMRSVMYDKPLDVAGVARAMGLHTAVVERPGELAEALRRALAVGGPALIEVRVDPEISPPLGDRAKSVAGFKK